MLLLVELQLLIILYTFLVLLPLLPKFEPTRPLPVSIGSPVLQV